MGLKSVASDELGDEYPHPPRLLRSVCKRLKTGKLRRLLSVRFAQSVRKLLKGGDFENLPVNCG